MAFDVREATAAAEATYPRFEIIDADGTVYYLPHPLMVNPGLAKKVQAGEITQTEALESMAPGVGAVLDRLEPAVLAMLLKEWRATVDDDVESLGKELEPLSAIPNSGPQPKRTSQRVASTSGKSRSGSSAARRKAS